MSIHTTPPIDPAHPLAKLIQRSIKAHKLPSCEGCKYYEDNIPSRPAEGTCYVRHLMKPSPIGDVDMFSVKNTHFCAAWEPKA